MPKKSVEALRFPGSDVKIAMTYQHPEEIVRAAIYSRHTLRHTGETATAQMVDLIGCLEGFDPDMLIQSRHSANRDLLGFLLLNQ